MVSTVRPLISGNCTRRPNEPLRRLGLYGGWACGGLRDLCFVPGLDVIWREAERRVRLLLTAMIASDVDGYGQVGRLRPVRQDPQHRFTDECLQLVIVQGAENAVVFIAGADERPSIRRETSQCGGNAHVIAAAGMHTVIFRPVRHVMDFGYIRRQ